MAYTAHLDTFARDRLPPRGQWPELLFELPFLRYPARLNCAAELLDRTAAAGHAGRPALYAPSAQGTVAWRYGELLARANRIAHVLRGDLGLVPGARVLLRGPNNPTLVACWFAVLKAGGIVVATMPLLRARELGEIIDTARVSIALCDGRLDEELRAAAAQRPGLTDIVCFEDGGHGALERLMEPHPTEFCNVDTAADDVALIAFTSGTTGRPKGTLHFHRDVMAMADCFPRACLEPSPQDICCGTPPIAFTFGLGSLVAFPMRFGAATALIERPSPELLLETVRALRVTTLFTAPTYYRRLAGIVGGFDVSSLRACVSAGEALPDATRQRFRQASGIEIIDGIGSTEMTHFFISHAPQRARRGATGYAIPGYRATVLDESGTQCPPGVVGRLAVKGPTGCRYLDDPRQRAYVQHGWNVTGDAFSMDEDGYFYYQARTDDMIVSAGYNISGPEVEAALLEHPAVAECGVVGVPDEERGQTVKAFVVLSPGHEPGERTVRALQEHAKSAIAPYKYPRRIAFVRDLPRTESGKLQRFRLREMG